MPILDDTWLAVADGRRARFFSTDATLEVLTELDGLVNAHKDPRHGHTTAEARFAAEVVDHLTTAAARRQFRDLVLVAPPHMLGDLRDGLPASVASHVTATIARDLVSIDARELSARVRRLLADAHLEAAR